MDKTTMANTHTDTTSTTIPDPSKGPTPPSPAQEAVFTTYELLESILLALPLEDLLLSVTKVSKNFHNTITSSVQISKNILSSPRFISALRTRRVKDPNIYHRTFF